MRSLVLLAAVAGLCGTARAERAYVTAGSEYRWSAVTVPRPSEQMGAFALRAVEASRTGTLPPVPVEGEPSSGPPAGWPGGDAAAADAMATGRAPFGAGAGERGGCDGCATRVGDTSTQRVAALYVVHEFEVGDELGGLRALHLRARYADGLVAYVNGREVARRHVDAGGGVVGFAGRPRGPEWETFYIPVTRGLLRRGTNVLAVEVRPSAVRLAPSLELELRATDGPSLVRGPIVQRVGERAATVVFDTDLPSRGRVDYGATPELGSTAASAGGALAVHHVVELRDLPPAAPVHYRVVVDGVAGPVYALHTAPAAGEVVRIAVYGDVRGGHETHARLIEAMAAEAPDMVLVTGDLVLRGTDEGDWQRFFAVTRDLLARVPYYTAAGNHDLGRTGDEQRRLNEVFALWPGPADRPEWGHWYSFDVAGIHFVMLDSNSYQHEQQLAWLRADLEAARARGVHAIFAFTHDGPWSRGPHRGNRYAAATYAPVLREHGVAMVFSGHDHLYQRGQVDGVRYAVTGGGGAPLYSIRCGVPGKPKCSVDDGAIITSSEHHYLMLTVYPTHFELCAKRPDGSPIERCQRFELSATAPR